MEEYYDEPEPEFEEITEYINKILKRNIKNPLIYTEIINLILIFDNVRDANPFITKNIDIVSDIVEFLNNYIDDEDDKIIILSHYHNINFTITKKRNEENVDRILKLFLNDDKTEAHSQYGEILGYYCYNQNWFNKDNCRVQMQIVNEKGIQITTEVCEFDIFKEEYGHHLGHFITKLNTWKDTINNYRINCELNGVIIFWILRDCKDDVDEFMSNNIYAIQNLGLEVKTKIIPPKDGKRKSRSKRRSKRSKRSK
jgi:hypothetical protein